MTPEEMRRIFLQRIKEENGRNMQRLKSYMYFRSGDASAFRTWTEQDVPKTRVFYDENEEAKEICTTLTNLHKANPMRYLNSGYEVSASILSALIFLLFKEWFATWQSHCIWGYESQGQEFWNNLKQQSRDKRVPASKRPIINI